MSSVGWAILSVSIAAFGVLGYYVYTALPQIAATTGKPKKPLSKKKAAKLERKQRAAQVPMAE